MRQSDISVIFDMDGTILIRKGWFWTAGNKLAKGMAFPASGKCSCIVSARTMCARRKLSMSIMAMTSPMKI